MTKRLRVLAVTVSISTVVGAQARAADPPGTYVMSVCRANGQPAPVEGWRRSANVTPPLVNGCSTGGQFGINASGFAGAGASTRLSWLWDAPPDLKVVGLRSLGVVAATRWNPRLIADGVPVGFGAVTTGNPLGSQWRELQGLNASRLALEISCGGAGEGECYPPYDGPPPTPRDVALFEQLDMVLRDEFAPVAVRSALTRLSPAVPLAGTVDLATDVSDRGGGVAYGEIVVDGVVQRRVEVADTSCSPPYIRPVPCPPAVSVGALIDTTALSDGVHNLELRFYDVARNSTTVGPVPVTVQNRQPSSSSSTTPGRIVLRKATVRSRYGARQWVEGVVTGLDDAPLAGASVEVSSRLRADGAPFAPADGAVTDSRGRFRVPVPRGPSRVYRLRYGASEANAEVLVRAPLRLTVSPSRTRNQEAVRFRGSIVGATAPGVRVELQARAGKKWVPFRTAALKRARFSASYRFTNTTARTRYTFRAVVRADPDLPYMPATSNVVSVLVRP